MPVVDHISTALLVRTVAGVQMPLPGGPADKLGNRYEALWTAYQLLRLLDGECESVRLEEPGVDKAEFVVRRGDRSEFHQAKRAGMREKWSLASLAAEGVLQSVKELLTDPNASFVFVSGCAAGELAELSDAARHAESEQEFMGTFLKAKTRGKPFERLRAEWQCDPETAIDYLRRVEVSTIGERDLEERVELHARTLFLADATGVVAELLRVLGKSVHKTIRRDELLEVMRRSGFLLRQVTNREQAVAAIRQATEGYLEGVRRRLIHRRLVPRAASKEVLEGVRNSATVLVGKAGSGKTACAVEIVEGLLGRRMEVLAFRLDRHVSATNTGDLGKRLGLEESPALMLAAAAEKNGRTGVLVVDQLDAVSTMSGRSSEALDLVENLLEEAKESTETSRPPRGRRVSILRLGQRPPFATVDSGRRRARGGWRVHGRGNTRAVGARWIRAFAVPGRAVALAESSTESLAVPGCGLRDGQNARLSTPLPSCSTSTGTSSEAWSWSGPAIRATTGRRRCDCSAQR